MTEVFATPVALLGVMSIVRAFPKCGSMRIQTGTPFADSQGVTAEFNLNLLRRINRELGADFECRDFHHFAFYEQARSRVDIRLISDCDQTVRIGTSRFEFSVGEAIHTEYSYKFTINGFANLVRHAGFALRYHWTAENDYFALLHLIRTK